MSVLVGSNVGKSFGAFDVFTALNFNVARGDKVALIGVNGCGKTTLLRIIAGADEANIGGEIRFARGVTRGYLAQAAEDSDESTVWQHAQDAFGELHAIQARMAKLEQDMLEPAKADRALEQYGTAQHEFELKGGYEMDAKIKRVLGGLGFKDDDVHQPLSHLSGGQRVRAALAQLLLQSPDVLLLDEPTNHLDRQGVEWLENFLQEWEGTLIVVSHDRYFLDEVCDQIWEMGRRMDGQSHIEQYRGGYTEYVQQRTERRERALLEFEAQQEFIKKQEEFIRRNMAGQNTAQAKGRLRRLNRLERLEKPVEQRAMSIRIKGGSRSGDRVLETSRLEVGYAVEIEKVRRGESKIASPLPTLRQAQGKPFSPSHLLFKSPDLLLLRTERAALIGPNGTGKTTFLKTIMGETPALKGEVKLGANVRVGYFAQAHEGLDPERTVLQELMSARDELKLSEARDILGRFLFSGDDQFKKVGMLSGGERGRVALAKLTLQGANFLLLDEPTNHLDIPSQEVLTESLNHFDGTLLMVSHDRYLIAALATQLWILDRNAGGQTSLSVFRGTYDAWRDSLDEAARARSEPAGNGQKPPEPKKAEPAQPTPAPQSAESKNRQQQRIAKMAAAEKRIEDLEHKLHELNWQMESAGADFAKIQSLSAEYAQTEIDLVSAWDELEKIS